MIEKGKHYHADNGYWSLDLVTGSTDSLYFGNKGFEDMRYCYVLQTGECVSVQQDDMPADSGISIPYTELQEYLNPFITWEQVVQMFLLNSLKRLSNKTYDSLASEYAFDAYAFSKLRERYTVWTRNNWEGKLYDSFGIRDKRGMLTNAGALLADDSPIAHSRLFCTRWDGLNKSGGAVDVLDDKEYRGSLISLLNEGVAFVRRNTRHAWKKTNTSRIEMPEYCERSVFEALVNALVHRDYSVLGSEVHVDIYDDRLTIQSPGGILETVPPTRRNPVLADIFERLGYMERKGSGLKKIRDDYYAAYFYREGLAPVFYSDTATFQVTLFNLNYGKEELMRK